MRILESIVVVVDAEGYGAFARQLQEIGPYAVVDFGQRIQKLITHSLVEVGAAPPFPPRKTRGDGAVLALESAETASRFSAAFQKNARDFADRTPRFKVPRFRIGIAKGPTVIYQALPKELGYSGCEIEGFSVSVATRLEQKCKPGLVLILEEVWSDLSDAEKQSYGSPLSIRGKGQEVFQARTRSFGASLVPIRGTVEPQVFRQRLAGLPVSGSNRFVGREAELKWLGRVWQASGARVVAIIGVGGIGKTTFIHQWLHQHLPRNVEIFVWSFHDQSRPEVSMNSFLQAALQFFEPRSQGIFEAAQGSLGDLGGLRERVAVLVDLLRQRRTLLILDGVEVLQRIDGTFKDLGMQLFLREMAYDNPGLVVVTSRQALQGFVDRPEEVRQRTLDPLELEEGAQLLRSFDVRGSEAEINRAIESVQGYSLAVALLGAYIAEVFGGDASRWLAEADAELAETGHEALRAILSSYDQWLGEGPEGCLLRILGLFEGPVDVRVVEDLIEPPIAVGSAEGLGDVGALRRAIRNLVRASLVAQSGSDTIYLDFRHSILREYFGHRLRQENHVAWQAVHSRVFDYLTSIGPELPDNREMMMPLYNSLRHASLCGRLGEAFSKIYRQRIQRGEAYNWRVLGDYSTNLTALEYFFEKPWNRPHADLSNGDRSWLLHETGLTLHSLGRLSEAVEPLLESARIDLEANQGAEAAKSFAEAAELRLSLGELKEARRLANRSVELSDDFGTLDRRVVHKALAGHICHNSGDMDRARSFFQEAEGLLGHGFLYSTPGYQYAEFLLCSAAPLDGSAIDYQDLEPVGLSEQLGTCGELPKRVASGPADSPLGIALDDMVRGRAALGQAIALGLGDQAGEAAVYLGRAIRGLRRVDVVIYMPQGLVAQAMLQRFLGSYKEAEDFLRQAGDLAEFHGMKLAKCDVLLEQSRLRLASGEHQGALASFKTADHWVKALRYHRRNREIEALATRLRRQAS